jgi:putative ABC transport system ATP-binding protein
MTTTTPRAAGVAAARIDGGTKVYGEGDAQVVALRGISEEFAPAQFTAIMGPSGSGKSTLLHCLAGLDDLTEGTVRIGDIELGSLKDKELTRLRRERVGFIFQAFNLIPTLTGEENILLPLSIAGTKPDRAWFDQVVEVLGLGDRLTHRPSELSGGQQQRVAAARALISRPDIVFADEPSGNLDSKSGAELLDFMRTAVREFGQTIVMVTHDPNSASYSERILFLDDGAVVHTMANPTAERVLDTMKTLGSS